MLEKHAIKSKYGPLDVGVRVEVPSIKMDPIIRINGGKGNCFRIYLTHLNPGK